MAMNPVIKFTTLFGLLAVELAVQLDGRPGPLVTICSPRSLRSLVFVWRSFYGIRIKANA